MDQLNIYTKVHTKSNIQGQQFVMKQAKDRVDNMQNWMATRLANKLPIED